MVTCTTEFLLRCGIRRKPSDEVRVGLVDNAVRSYVSFALAVVAVGATVLPLGILLGGFDGLPGVDCGG